MAGAGVSDEVGEDRVRVGDITFGRRPSELHSLECSEYLFSPSIINTK